jgi:hypothetical protein
MAKEALTLHISGMMEDGEELTEPSTLEAIMADPDMDNAAAYLVVDINLGFDRSGGCG